MRRRIKVFAAVFLLSLAATQAWNFMRPAIYQANARVEISPPGQVAATPGQPTAAAAPGRAPAGISIGTSNQPAGSPAFLAEVQVLSSRQLLEKAVAQLRQQGRLKVEQGDPVQAAQAMLSITPVEGTQVVQLRAEGPEPVAVASLVNAVLDAYGQLQTNTGEVAAKTEVDNARKEVEVIDAKVDEKRKALNAFGARSDIVSGERDENAALARAKGLSTSLASAAEKEASAAGKVRALEQAAADGKRATFAKDNPTVAAIEARLSQAREDWKALERQFTQKYLDLDPNAKALKTRIANLEQQLEAERHKGTQMALSDAREELATVQATSQRLRQQLAEERQGAQAFSQRFASYQTMQTELAGLQQMQQAARQKLLALEASESARKPRLQVLEQAAVPEAPWRPQYWRDAALGLAASLLLGFLAVWFVEFFNRADPPPPQTAPTIVVQQPWMAVPHGAQAPQLGGSPMAMGVLEHAPPAAPAAALLAKPLPRELTPREVGQLLAASAPEHALMLACLLCGLSAEELVGLHGRDVDSAAGVLRVAGDGQRAVPLPAPLQGLAAPQDAAQLDAPLFNKAGGRALDLDDVASAVTSAAYDAGLDQPQTVTPEALRHTYIAFLVRQGLRFGELSRLAGRMSTDTLNGLAPLAPEGQRVGLDAVEKLLPALRGA